MEFEIKLGIYGLYVGRSRGEEYIRIEDEYEQIFRLFWFRARTETRTFEPAECFSSIVLKHARS